MNNFSSKIVLTAFIWLWSLPRGWGALWKWPVHLLLTPYIAIRYRNELPEALEKVEEELMFFGIPEEFQEDARVAYEEYLENISDDSDDESYDEFEINEIDVYSGEIEMAPISFHFPVRFVDGGIVVGNISLAFLDRELSEFPFYWYREGKLYTANSDAKAHSPKLPDAAIVTQPDKLARAVAELTPQPSS